MDREAWRAAIHGVAKSRTRLSDWTDWTSQFTLKKLAILGLSCEMWDLIFWSGIKPGPPALGAWCRRQWTSRKALNSPFRRLYMRCVAVFLPEKKSYSPFPQKARWKACQACCPHMRAPGPDSLTEVTPRLVCAWHLFNFIFIACLKNQSW